MAEMNGATAPKIQRRERWVELPDEYEGFKFRVWVNAPTKLWTAIGRAGEGGNEEQVVDALKQIVLEHNGWLDFDGQPYPPANTSEFWEEVPTELAACVIAATQAEQTKLPNSLAPKRRR